MPTIFWKKYIVLFFMALVATLIEPSIGFYCILGVFGIGVFAWLESLDVGRY